MIFSLVSFFAANPVFIAQQTPIPAIVSPASSVVDRDKDGFFDEQDFCPKIPGENKGCPNIKPFRIKRAHDLVFRVLDGDRFFAKEKDEIRLGDLFSAGFYDKASGKIWNESETLEVTR